MPSKDPPAPPMEQDILAVAPAATHLTEIEGRLTPDSERAEPRRRAMTYL